ncbi:unnamed protein product [Echinostoma caproni]|uniref:ML domain-containing protein n=1 Tax=Echinostoma caproni TaxID=27848 RepID=A0A183B424_9TREM|nr:unnamed protein product [Echinostoma caproni]
MSVKQRMTPNVTGLDSIHAFSVPTFSLACIRASVAMGLRLFLTQLTPKQMELGQLSSVEPMDICSTDATSCPPGSFCEVKLSEVRSGSHAVSQIEAVLTVLS